MHKLSLELLRSLLELLRSLIDWRQSRRPQRRTRGACARLDRPVDLVPLLLIRCLLHAHGLHLSQEGYASKVEEDEAAGDEEVSVPHHAVPCDERVVDREQHERQRPVVGEGHGEEHPEVVVRLLCACLRRWGRTPCGDVIRGENERTEV